MHLLIYRIAIAKSISRIFVWPVTPKSVPPKSVRATDFGKKTGPPDQFWLPKSVLPGTDFSSQNRSPIAKNGPPSGKTESLYPGPAHACILIIYAATYVRMYVCKPAKLQSDWSLYTCTSRANRQCIAIMSH